MLKEFFGTLSVWFSHVSLNTCPCPCAKQDQAHHVPGPPCLRVHPQRRLTWELMKDSLLYKQATAWMFTQNLGTLDTDYLCYGLPLPRITRDFSYVSRVMYATSLFVDIIICFTLVHSLVQCHVYVKFSYFAIKISSVRFPCSTCFMVIFSV